MKAQNADTGQELLKIRSDSRCKLVHDLNNKLSIVIASCELALDRIADDNVRARLLAADKAAHDMAELISYPMPPFILPVPGRVRKRSCYE